MEVVGYALIKPDAKTGQSPIPISKFIGHPVRVMEFAHDGGVLVLDPEATGLGMFDACDVKASFKCRVQGEVLMPPELNVAEQMLYYGKVITRKGGYNNTLKQMVIHASLGRGKFTDSFLFQQPV